MTKTKSNKPKSRQRIGCFRPTRMGLQSRGSQPKWSWEILSRLRTTLKNLASRSKNRPPHNFCRNLETWVSNRASQRICYRQTMPNNPRAIITPNKSRILVLAPNRFFLSSKRSLSSKIQMHNITLQIRLTNLRHKLVPKTNNNNLIQVWINWGPAPVSEISLKLMFRPNKINSRTRVTDKPQEVLQVAVNLSHQLVSPTRIWTRSQNTIKMVNSSRTKMVSSNRKVRINWRLIEGL